jgi:hypothetical protein
MKGTKCNYAPLVEQWVNGAEYKSGDTYTSATVSSRLGLTTQQAISFNKHTVALGLARERKLSQGRGSSKSGTLLYYRPTNAALFIKWRQHTDEELGICLNTGH